MAKTEGRRDEMVIATKYTGSWKAMSEPDRIQSNFGGNGTKSLHLTVEKCLKNLQTSYIDLFYVHICMFYASPKLDITNKPRGFHDIYS